PSGSILIEPRSDYGLVEIKTGRRASRYKLNDGGISNRACVCAWLRNGEETINTQIIAGQAIPLTPDANWLYLKAA
ncbi:hypothetical protein NPM20_25875, partial [Vibrio parahaemolyticus]|nr:hypothetical protein [Vibrio parahaemolyticus]